MILFSSLLLVLALLSAYTLSACNRSESDDGQIKIQTFPPGESASTPSDSDKPDFSSTPPALSEGNNKDITERHIVVTEQNNTFSIGVPPGHIEETEVIAEKNIDFWFQYVPDDLALQVNGIPVERSFHWETKVGYTTNVKNFKYTATNETTQYFSYNLHLVPLKSGGSVPVTVRQKWSPLIR